MTARLYDLSSTWTFPKSREEVWDAIAGNDLAWPKWWPGCTYAEPPKAPAQHGLSDEERLLATSAMFNFKALLGYTLKVEYQPTAVTRLEEVKFDASVDLEGEGRVFLQTTDDGQTRMDIEWRVRPTHSWMKFIEPVAAPAFTSAHAHLLRSGERGLRNYLAANGRNAESNEDQR